MRTSVVLSLALLSLAACRKDEKIVPKVTTAKSNIAATASQDTIPDKAAFRIELYKDSVNHDETMIQFDHTAGLTYSPDRDGLYFTGFGQLSLASISGDNKHLAIYSLPYKQNMAVGLDVETRSDGAYSLKMSFQRQLPGNTQVWLKDMYLKDSTNICMKDYSFSVVKADSNSFGCKRFKLVVREASGQQQTAVPN
ncbi:MAG: hypothetical protein JST32_08825 [Bacteroidetes bacterium]|nr:hypothetical protein [Bacteroidota bacterium]